MDMDDVVEVVAYGNFACFTRSESKIDRVTYDAPTPSACRGILAAIYCEPKEFWYEIIEIDVLKPIRRMSMVRNEVKKKTPARNVASMNVDAERTQRNTTYLTDVAYRIVARIHPRETYRPDHTREDNVRKLKGEFERRVRLGKCFWQPYLGLRECLAFFRPPTGDDVPIDESAEFGTTLYDVFDPKNCVPLNTDSKATETCRPVATYFDSKMVDGRIRVPSRYEIMKRAGIEQGGD